MANVWFTSDLHFGHKNIGNFREFVEDEQHNTAYITESWFSLVSKRDVVWVLGDIAFNEQGFADFLSLPGNKKLVLGNHDRPFFVQNSDKFNHQVYGLATYRGSWLSHSPVHPNELRGKTNLHGHVHTNTIPDGRYFNCCVENCVKETGECLISLNELRERGYLLA